jgi:uncharacterized membrane protein
MKREGNLRIASVANCYGILAQAISRGRFVARDLRREGLAYDQAHGFLWAEIAAFITVGLLSVTPTIRIIR